MFMLPNGSTLSFASGKCLDGIGHGPGYEVLTTPSILADELGIVPGAFARGREAGGGEEDVKEERYLRVTGVLGYILVRCTLVGFSYVSDDETSNICFPNLCKAGKYRII